MNIHQGNEAGDIYEEAESAVRSYCRSFPLHFTCASGSHIHTREGDAYLDLLSGCGSLNYGHNHPVLRDRLVSYIQNDGLAMGLDLHSSAKEQFLKAFQTYVLAGRNLDYRIQFTGPTGANAVEASIKLARKVTGRRNVVAFTNAFHGCSLGALSLTGNRHHRAATENLLDGVIRMPFDGYMGEEHDTSLLIRKLLNDPSGGIDPPAAVILEAVQGEGGLNVASEAWATSIARAATEAGALLIVDEIQTGCGRTGTFFAFEQLGIVPDIVTMAKSLSGYGIPMAAILIRKELDVWEPAEHNGTFRGNCHAFVTAAAALECFWRDEKLIRGVRLRSEFILHELSKIAQRLGLGVCGRGMMMGVRFQSSAAAALAKRECLARKMLIETCGSEDEVLKLMPPLNISDEDLGKAVAIIADAATQAGA